MFQNTQEEIGRLLLGFFTIGVGLGAVYDLLRILRVAIEPSSRKSGWRKRLYAGLHFLGDLLFAAFAAVTVILAGYFMNRGRIRGDMLLLLAAGFLLQHFTVGRLVYAAAGVIVGTVRGWLGWLWRHTVLPPVRWLRRLAARYADARRKMRFREQSIQYYKQVLKRAGEYPESIE